jgi:hypothetical protein
MKFKSSEIKLLLEASYMNESFDIDKFKIDRPLSNRRVKVYTVDDSDEVVVTHRGSADLKDWVDNSTWLRFNLLERSPTYKIHLRKHMKAVHKYGANKINVMGHSRGGLYATNLYKNKLAKQVINYNKPINLYDIARDIVTKKKEDGNSTTIRTSNDLVSIGQNLMKGNETDIVIPSDSYNPIKEHGIDKIDDYQTDELIGKGMFKPQINYAKLRTKELRDFVKKNKKKVKLDINVTGLTKKDLIELTEYILSKK